MKRTVFFLIFCFVINSLLAQKPVIKVSETINDGLELYFRKFLYHDKNYTVAMAKTYRSNTERLYLFKTSTMEKLNVLDILNSSMKKIMYAYSYSPKSGLTVIYGTYFTALGKTPETISFWAERWDSNFIPIGTKNVIDISYYEYEIFRPKFSFGLSKDSTTLLLVSSERPTKKGESPQMNYSVFNDKIEKINAGSAEIPVIMGKAKSKSKSVFRVSPEGELYFVTPASLQEEEKKTMHKRQDGDVLIYTKVNSSDGAAKHAVLFLPGKNVKLNYYSEMNNEIHWMGFYKNADKDADYDLGSYDGIFSVRYDKDYNLKEKIFHEFTLDDYVNIKKDIKGVEKKMKKVSDPKSAIEPIDIKFHLDKLVENENAYFLYLTGYDVGPKGKVKTKSIHVLKFNKTDLSLMNACLFKTKNKLDDVEDLKQKNVVVIHKNKKSYVFFKSNKLDYTPKDQFSKLDPDDGERLGYLIHDLETDELSPQIFDFNDPKGKSKDMKRIFTMFDGRVDNPQFVGFYPEKRFSSDKTAYSVFIE